MFSEQGFIVHQELALCLKTKFRRSFTYFLKNSSRKETIPENEEKPRKFDALIETPKTNSGRLGNQVDTVGI